MYCLMTLKCSFDGPPLVFSMRSADLRKSELSQDRTRVMILHRVSHAYPCYAGNEKKGRRLPLQEVHSVVCI